MQDYLQQVSTCSLYGCHMQIPIIQAFRNWKIYAAAVFCVVLSLLCVYFMSSLLSAVQGSLVTTSMWLSLSSAQLSQCKYSLPGMKCGWTVRYELNR